MFKKLIYGLCLAAALPAVPADAFTYRPMQGHSVPSSSAMGEQGNALSPYGYTQFCISNPGECRARNSHKGDRIQLSLRNWGILKDVNRSVNASIRPRREESDRWSVNSRTGDCEDYALTKRNRLISRGFSSSALVVATGKLPNGQDHAVLMVKTDKGDYVLDNLRSGVVAWNTLPYRWQKRQSSRNPRLWVNLFRPRRGGPKASYQTRTAFCTSETPDAQVQQLSAAQFDAQ